jgi:hypothetical protein
MNRIVCGEENAAGFNAALRETCPDFHRLAADLFKSGLITGLRRARLTIGTAEEMAELAEKETAKGVVLLTVRKTCDGCKYWRRDQVGYGEGVGGCAIGGLPNKLKWPKQTACREFAALKGGKTDG